ncbi:hypothetical protein NDU88_001060 [Pleurodeles waltl]|uniref:Uncharacterized protein n=1 Tax=Pleurodeles waltl TaxID=8319 RepID=A0AAV7WH90_PLEWA|nr:hypothetical protein NDU88_001060 [Pleurodeles waltl]
MDLIGQLKRPQLSALPRGTQHGEVRRRSDLVLQMKLGSLLGLLKRLETVSAGLLDIGYILCCRRWSPLMERAVKGNLQLCLRWIPWSDLASEAALNLGPQPSGAVGPWCDNRRFPSRTRTNNRSRGTCLGAITVSLSPLPPAEHSFKLDEQATDSKRPPRPLHNTLATGKTPTETHNIRNKQSRTLLTPARN